MATKWKVKGTAVVKDGSGQRVDPYEAEFTLDEGDKGVAQSMLRRGYVSDYLRDNVSGFRRVRTMAVIGGGKPDGEHKADAVEKALNEAAREGVLPENLDQYQAAEDKAEAVKRGVAKKKAAVKKKSGKKSVVDEGYID